MLSSEQTGPIGVTSDCSVLLMQSQVKPLQTAPPPLQPQNQCKGEKILVDQIAAVMAAKDARIRSVAGCWTCRLRRKKCDGTTPTCKACVSLEIFCNYDLARPEWMDGGERQEQMTKLISRQVSEAKQRRRVERTIAGLQYREIPSASYEQTLKQLSRDDLPPLKEKIEESQQLESSPQITAQYRTARDTSMLNTGLYSAKCTLMSSASGKDAEHFKTPNESGPALEKSDSTLISFHLEHVVPFLLPFYQPSPFEGGKSWVLDLVLKSPVVREAAMCQSAYFFSLGRRTNECGIFRDRLFAQTKDAFETLRQALQVILSSDVEKHLHGAVRILAGIVLLQRFEVAASNFENCPVHMNASLALFQQIMATSNIMDPVDSPSAFATILTRLGPSSWMLPESCLKLPSAEQAAFRFSTAILFFDDIIESTVFRRQPRLYKHYRGLLTEAGDSGPIINLAEVIGCQNWVLLHIAEIATLDAWKLQCEAAGDIELRELLRRASLIEGSLKQHLADLEASPITPESLRCSLIDIFIADTDKRTEPAANIRHLLTRIWAHAAMLYVLNVTERHLQYPDEVGRHVSRAFELMTARDMPVDLLRAKIWPFCIVGCFAEREREAGIRQLAETLTPASVFGSVRKALEIMEEAWRCRGSEDVLAALYQSKILLV